MAHRLDSRSRAEHNRYVPATELATGLFGDAATANVLLLGVALQAGAVPIAAANIEHAIELNGVAVERNLAALRWGRQWVIDPEAVAAAAGLAAGLAASSAAEAVATTDQLIARRAADLVGYQSKAYAQEYLDTIQRIRAAGASAPVIEAVARNLHKLMAYKDEYEVARLLLAPEAKAAAVEVGGKGASVTWQLHPPLLRSLGMKNKLQFGRWATPALMSLRAARRLRGTALDIPGWTSLRRTERALAGEYASTVERVVAASVANGGVADDVVLQIAELADMVRGYESIKVANIAAYRTRLAELATLVGS